MKCAVPMLAAVLMATTGSAAPHPNISGSETWEEFESGRGCDLEREMTEGGYSCPSRSDPCEVDNACPLWNSHSPDGSRYEKSIYYSDWAHWKLGFGEIPVIGATDANGRPVHIPVEPSWAKFFYHTDYGLGVNIALTFGNLMLIVAVVGGAPAIVGYAIFRVWVWVRTRTFGLKAVRRPGPWGPRRS